MSNPSVFMLNKSKIKDSKFCIEDNIGEAIHFHIGMVRFDLTVKEFLNISSTLLNVLEDLVNIKDFKLVEQDEIFLERIATSIPYIEEIKTRSVKISQLKYRYEDANGEITSAVVLDTPVYKYYQGEIKSLNDYDFEKDIWQTNEEILEYVKVHNSNTIIYVDENLYILDGYKSVCSLLMQHGDDYEVNVKIISTSKGNEPKYVLNKEKKHW